MKPDVLGGLASHFALLSLAAVGGANAVVPEIHRVAVDQSRWLTEREFADLFAIANAAPGPNVLFVALIGWKVAGVLGGIIALAAMCGPSSLLTYVAARLRARVRGGRLHEIVRLGLGPVAVGLVLASGYVLTRAADHGVTGFAITAAVTVAALRTKRSPLWFLAAAAALGIAGVG
jgi:chromate transporter